MREASTGITVLPRGVYAPPLIGNSRNLMRNTQGTVSLCLLPRSDFAHSLSIKIDGSVDVLDSAYNPENVSEIL